MNSSFDKLWNDKFPTDIKWNDKGLVVEEKNKDYQQILLGHYIEYFKSAEATSERRLKTNAFFLTINTAILSVLAYVLAQNVNPKISVVAIAAGLGGMAVSYVWYTMLSYMRGINSAKFKVLGEIEKRLLCRPMSDGEWSILENARAWNLWEFVFLRFYSKKFRKEAEVAIRYSSLAKEEQKIPLIVGFLYFVALASGITLFFRPHLVPHDQIEIAPIQLELEQLEKTPLKIDLLKPTELEVAFPKGVQFDPVELSTKELPVTIQHNGTQKHDFRVNSDALKQMLENMQPIKLELDGKVMLKSDSSGKLTIEIDSKPGKDSKLGAAKEPSK